MLLAAVCFCLLSSVAGYHLSPEFQEHSTALDYLRTTNKTINDLLEGKLNVECIACEIFVDTLQMLVKMNASENEIANLIVEACIKLNIEDQRVCSEIINEFRDEFITVALKLILYPDWLCYAALGPSCGEPPDIFPFWNVTIPGNKPKPQPLVRPRHGLPVLKVVQLSDVHVDLEYKPGGVKDCGEPLCCREGSGVGQDKAGFWGSLNCDCDIPLWTYKNALEFISKEIKPDLIFWTGDIPAHNVWDQPRAAQLHHIQITADLLSQYFPDTFVYPSLGNHESAPVDSFPPPGITTKNLSNDWLNQFIKKVWSRWLPPESLETIGYAGYYAVQYSERLRIISLNTQYCDSLNFWLYLNNTDPAHMLHWLVEELTWAEQAGVSVVILGHIPTSRSDCMKAFSWNFYRIIDRFEATVVGQYYGHTHQDQFAMMYSEEEDHHPTGFQFISPSLTTYSNQRPSIRVYTLDGIHPKSTYRPLKAETWLLDLDRANEKNETVWELEYDSTNAYNMTWLTPDTMQNLYEKFVTDRDFFTKTYFKYKFHLQPGSTCNDSCYKNNLCEIKTGRSHDPSICKDISMEEQQKFFLQHKMC